MSLPSGTITFLFSEIEGSARLWENYPEAMRVALARHDALIREGIESHGGHVFKTVGDSFCAAFGTPAAALVAAIAIQQALITENWQETGPLRVRIALHTGTAEERDNDYFGPPLNRIARVLAAGYGGQTLLTQATELLVRGQLPPAAELLDLGEHRLRDIKDAIRIYQVRHPALPSEFPPLKSESASGVGAARHNLPRQLTSFIGREREIAEVKRLLASTPLLTLVGTGGAGKTRLSLKVAEDLLPQYPNGVWVAELAALADPALVPQAVASALDVREEPGRPLLQTLIDYIKPRSLLLILDNCEHLLTACAQLAATLLRQCPRLRILASSREALNVPGEIAWRLPSLALPDPNRLPPLESLSQYESLRLFAERATALAPAFVLTETNAPTIAQICHRLDGIPLALELSAARVRSLPVEQIARRLDDCFRLLTGGSRTALPRQQTLRALIDWSYDLLNAQECLMLHRLAVFAGGWTLEDAEAICIGAGEDGTSLEDWEILDLLASLVDKSLVVYEEQTQGGRYRLLETIRQYALEKLQASEPTGPLRYRHAARFQENAQKRSGALESSEEAAQAVLADLDNMRAGMDWAAQQNQDALTIRYMQALARFFLARGLYSEGEGRLEAAVAAARRDGDPKSLAQLLLQRGRFAWNRSDLDEASRFYLESYDLSRGLGDRPRLVPVLINLGNIAWSECAYRAARAQYEEALALARETQQPRYEAFLLGNLGLLASDRGDFEAANQYLEEALQMHERNANEKGCADTLMHMADLQRNQKQFEAAKERLEGSLKRFIALGQRHEHAFVCVRFAELLVEEGRFEEAEARVEEGLQIAAEIDDPWCEMPGLAIKGRIVGARGDLSGACALYRRSLAIAQEKRIGGRKHLAELLSHFGQTLLENGRREEAYQALVTALREFAALELFDRFEIEPRLQNLRAQIGEDAAARLDALAETASADSLLALL